MTKPSPKFYIAESERLSDEDPEKVDRLTHEAVGTRTGKREIDYNDCSPIDANTSLPVDAKHLYNYHTPGAPVELHHKILLKANDSMLKKPEGLFEITEGGEQKGERKATQPRKQRTRYIPSVNQQEDLDDTHIEEGENSPLLDVSNNIEQKSEDWPIDPENQSEIYSNSTQKRLYYLNYPFGKPKRFLMEIFILVNMAQLMYVAALCFTKTLIVVENVTIANLSMYRFTLLFAIEALRQSCCSNLFEESDCGKALSAVSEGRGDESNSKILVATTMYLVQAILSIMATLLLVIGLKTVPLSYLVMGFNITHLSCTSFEKLFSNKLGTHTMLSLLFSMVTAVFAICSVQLIKAPAASATGFNQPSLNDPLIQLIFSQESLSNLSERKVFLIGIWATVGSSLCYNIANRIKKSELVNQGVNENKQFAVVTICFIVSFLALVASQASSQGTEADKEAANISELFWIGVFSLTAKAAYSMSFDEDENPSNVKLISLLGVFYSVFIDKSLYTYEFSIMHLQIGSCLLVLCMVALLLQSKQHTQELKEKEKRQKEQDPILRREITRACIF